jgi:hypothetical protein
LNIEGADSARTSKTPALANLTLLSSRVRDICEKRDYRVADLAAEVGIPARYENLMAAESLMQAADFDRVSIGRADAKVLRHIPRSAD